MQAAGKIMFLDGAIKDVISIPSIEYTHVINL
jgi:hypothetical protein